MLVKPIPSIHIVAGLVVTASLVACANPSGSGEHGGHHAGQPANATVPGPAGAPPAQGGMMGGGMTGSHAGCGMMGDSKAGCPGGMRQMDKETMCAMYRGMRDAPNEQARQSMMDQHMQAMSPEMRQQHMEMMRQQCQ
jgi:hypothetical protein